MEQTDPQKDQVKYIIECLIFASDTPLTVEKIKSVLEDKSKKEIKALIEELIQDFQNLDRGIFIREVANGFQFCTRPEYAHLIQKLRKTKPYSLTQPTLETLAIIAYRQPVTKAEIELVRGVDCGGVLRTLLEKKLIAIKGKKEVIGRPFLYATTSRFLEVFGLENLPSLPSIEEIKQLKNSDIPLFEQDSQ
jgi:segregation and condensation protein B